MSSTYGIVPQKVDLTPRKHHGYAALLFIVGTLFPPLAVAARFGIGKDFWINLFLTVCGYIPGHAHNFYIQNIRNNKTHARTPKWVQKYGLVDTAEIRRKERKSQWAKRYDERLPRSVLEGQPLEEGQEPSSSIDPSAIQNENSQQNGNLWRPEDEQYYNSTNNASNSSSSGRWHYPANFEDVEPIEPPKRIKKKKEKEKKDRWERTNDAYTMSADERKKKKKKKRRNTETESTVTNESGDGFPEDPDGGLYGDRSRPLPSTSVERSATTDAVVFNHEL